MTSPDYRGRVSAAIDLPHLRLLCGKRLERAFNTPSEANLDDTFGPGVIAAEALGAQTFDDVPAEWAFCSGVTFALELVALSLDPAHRSPRELYAAVQRARHMVSSEKMHFVA